MVGELQLVTGCVRRAKGRPKEKWLARLTGGHNLSRGETITAQQINGRELWRYDGWRWSGAAYRERGLLKEIVGAGKHEYAEIKGQAGWGVSCPTVDSLQLIPAKRNLVFSPRAINWDLKVSCKWSFCAWLSDFLCLFPDLKLHFFFSCGKTETAY